jgi:Ca2+-binding RTX toxin-like protein
MRALVAGLTIVASVFAAGLGGDDVLRGEGGNDVLEGGRGSDRLLGGAGQDRLLARDGVADTGGGGPGRDTGRVDAGVDRFSSVEELT